MGLPIPKPFEAYKGRDPYIFVSYAHADKEDVYADIGHLHEAGYRVWYDEGITPNESLIEQIAKAIMACSYVIAFLSPSALNSSYVDKEIFTALNKEKQLLPIHLQEIHYPPRLEFQLAHILSLNKYEYTREEYLVRLKKFLPDALAVDRGFPEGSLERDFEREIRRAISDARGLTESLTAELLTTAEFLGLSAEAAGQVLKVTLERHKPDGVKRFRKLVAHFLNSGEIVHERRQILANRAREWDIPPEQWEALVQEEAALRARVLYQEGEMEGAKRVLISSVGEHVPQSAEVRLLIEQLEVKSSVTAAAPSAPAPPDAARAEPAQTTHHRAVARLSSGATITWVHIPAGLFLRGCPEDFIQHVEMKYGVKAKVLSSYPVKKEPLGAFWISLTPITNVLFYDFVKATGHRFPAGWRGTTPPYPSSDAEMPVTGVTWQDSVDFAEWLGAALPTRAEYEKACRGQDGLLFPWGNAFDASRCNTAESQRGRLTPVNAYPEGASPYGVLDLVGNVWEWAADSRGPLQMTVGASFDWLGEIYGAGFFDMSRPPVSSENDLGFRLTCGDVTKLLVDDIRYED